MEPTNEAIFILAVLVVLAVIFIGKLLAAYGSGYRDERVGGWNQVYCGSRDSRGASIYTQRKAWKL